MSAQQDGPAEAPSGSISCPRCQSIVIRGQDWCLICGASARTRLAPSPNWRLPIGIVGTLLVTAAVVLVIALIVLTDHSTSQTETTSTTAPAGPTTTTPPASTTTPAP